MSAEPAETARRPRRGVTTSVARAAGIIAVATLLARVAGFARTLVFSDSVGTSGVGSVYQTVNTIPNVLFEVAAGGVLAAAAVPLIAGQLGAQREDDADQTSSALLTWAVSVLLPLSALLALAAPALSDFMLGARYSQEAVDLGTRMLVIFAPQVVLYGIGIVLTGVLQARRSFLAPALAPLLSSLVVIAAYVAYGQLTEAASSPEAVSDAAVLVLAGGTTLGVVVLSLPLFVPAWRAGARLRPTFRFPEGTVPRVAALAGAGMVALLAQQAAVLVTLWLANNRGSQGAVNVYAYVQAVYLLPYAVLAVPIATSAFPALAHGEGTGRRVHGTLSRSLQAILLLCGGAAAVLVAIARPVGTFFQALDRGANAGGGDALAAIPATLVAYAPGLVGFGAAALLTRALYVRGRPALAALAVAGGWLVAALWPVITLPDDAGAAGTLRSLGAASSVGMTLSALALALLVRRAWGVEATRGAGRTLGALVVAAAVSAGIGDVLAFYWAPTGLTGAVLASVVIAGVVTVLYLAVMFAADRGAMQAALQRGRRRRGSDA